jgi:hypothetical protein
VPLLVSAASVKLIAAMVGMVILYLLWKGYIEE